MRRLVLIALISVIGLAGTTIFLVVSEDPSPPGPDLGGFERDDRGEDGPDLGRLYDECEAGDFAACDELYFDALLGSALERFGSTCGGRTSETDGDCE